MKTGEKFWQIRNSAETGGHAELVLYGDISRTSWWGDEITPQKFAADLAAIPAEDDLTVRICSGGGDVWAAQAIGSQLESRTGTVTAQIEGLASRKFRPRRLPTAASPTVSVSRARPGRRLLSASSAVFTMKT